MTDTEARGRRGRGGGGAARRAERSAVSFETAKYIERNIPNLEILNEEALQSIEANADTILEEIGVNFPDNPKALERWREAGANVDGERVRIPRGLARELCKTAPSEYTQHARNPERNVVVGGRNSNNTRQLVHRIEAKGKKAFHIESADELKPDWFTGSCTVGLTAGTSTPDSVINTVSDRLASFTPATAKA